MSLHHVALVHSSRPNHSSDRHRISMGYLPTDVATTSLKASAMLMRGEDDFGFFTLDELPPVSAVDEDTVKRHERAVSLYREKAVNAVINGLAIGMKSLEVRILNLVAFFE